MAGWKGEDKRNNFFTCYTQTQVSLEKLRETIFIFIFIFFTIRVFWVFSFDSHYNFT